MVAPDFDNFIPLPGASGVPVDTNISFDILDQDGVDIDTLEVYINGGRAIHEGLEQDGYDVTITPISGGYSVTIDPFDLPPFEFIEVDILVADSFGEYSEASYMFRTKGDLLPVFNNIFPAPFSVNNKENDNIIFNVEDSANNGILLPTLEVYINTVPVILGGEVQDGYSAEIVAAGDGYYVEIEHPPFGAFTTVYVSLSANNFDNNNFTYEYSYDVSDRSGPIIVNNDPATGAIEVQLDTHVCFDLVDYANGVDLDSVVVTIDGQTVFEDGSFIYPFDDSESSVSIIDDLEYLHFENFVPIFTPVYAFYPGEYFQNTFLNEDGYEVIVDGYTDGYDGYDGYQLDGYVDDGYDGYSQFRNLGYRFCFDNRVNFRYSQNIVVSVYSTDRNGNESNISYSFNTMEEFGPPIFNNVSPTDLETSVPLDSDISFNFVDTGSGAKLDTLSVVIAGKIAISGGEFQDGYSGTTVFEGDGYYISIVPNIPLPNYTNISVSLSGEDFVGNSALYQYSFQTIDQVSPEFDSIYPVPNSIAVETDTVLRFSFNDPNQTGAKLDSLGVRVLGSLVVIDGNALDGYTIEATANAFNGYDVQITFNNPLPEYTLVDVVLDGRDNAGNDVVFEYSFYTADESGPVFENLQPTLDTKVSKTAPVIIDILDYGIGVDTSTIGLSINGISVIDTGITQPNGFVTELTPIEHGYRLYAQSIGVTSHDIDGYTAALWKLDDTGSTIVNAQGDAALNGTKSSGVVSVAGKIDGALSFGINVNDRVDISGEQAGLHSQDTTIEAWIKPTTLSSSHTIYTFNPRQTITQNRGIALQVTSTGSLKLLFGGGTGPFATIESSTGLITTNAYYHVAAVVNSLLNTVELYINGTKVKTDARPYAISYTDDVVGFPSTGRIAFIGNRINPFTSDYTDGFIGFIDDVRVSTKARTSSEIANSYNRGVVQYLSEYASIPVSIFVSDFAGNDGYLDYYFNTLDETPPVFTLINPVDGEVRVDINTDIVFNFTDAYSGPNLDSLNVTVDGKTIIESGLGYNSFVSFYDIPDGYRVEIDLDTSLPEFKNIVVSIDGYDIDPNYTTLTYQFSTDDITPPVLVDPFPSDGATEIDPFTSVQFFLHDFNASGVDTSSVNVQVDDRNVILSGVPQSGWTVSVIPDEFDGYTGFRYLITSDRRYKLGSSIRVYATGNDAYGNIFVNDYAFSTFSDVIAPAITSLSPAISATSVALNANIVFNITDAYDVDLDRLSVHINNNPAILNGQFQNGYLGNSSGIYAIPDGYGVDIDPENYFEYNQQISVVIDGYDLSNNHVNLVYYFNTIADVAAPTISNRSPAASATSVPNNSDIRFDITDPSGVGVELNKLNVHIDSIPAILGGVFQTGWNGSSAGIESITDGYRIVIDPIDPYNFTFNQIHSVVIDGYDLANNHISDIYTFTTVLDSTGPTLANIVPAPSSTEVSVSTNISFDITDAVSLVDMTRLDVVVDDLQAIQGGIIQYPFNDWASGFTTITDGYHVTLNLFVDFDYNKFVSVTIDGYDLAGNQTHLDFTFNTKVDVEGPIVTPIYPLDSTGDWARDTDVYLKLTDSETGVDLYSIDITVDNRLVIENGVFVDGSGFDGAESKITQLLDGYEFFLDSTIVFPTNYTARVVVDGYDYANNQRHFEYIFTTVDDIGPEIFDFHPVANSVNAANNPVNISFTIIDNGGGKVDLNSLLIEISEEADGDFMPVYDSDNEFYNGWTGLISNSSTEDGYIVDMTKIEQGKSFALYSVKITASDNLGNSSTSIIGKTGGFIDDTTGIISGFDTINVGATFINSNQISHGDIVFVHSVGAFVVDGYTSTDIILDRQIPAGGSVNLEIYRGSFMLEKRFFGAQDVDVVALDHVNLIYSDPIEINASVLDPTSYIVTGGEYPINIIGVDQVSEDTFTLLFHSPTQSLVEYTITILPSDIENVYGFLIDDGYKTINFVGHEDIYSPRVDSAINAPFNINVTVIFNEAMSQNNDLLNPDNYILSHGAYATAVSASPSELDRVVLTVENLFNRSQFDIFVSGLVRDAASNLLDPQYNHAVINIENSGAALSGATGRVKTRDAVKRLYEDNLNWYLATEGGLDVVSKLDLENKGFVLDGYGYSSVTATASAIYFGNNDGYGEDAYGVLKLNIADLSGNSTSKVIGIFTTTSDPAIISNEINDLYSSSYGNDELLGVATINGATVVKNETTVINYSAGNDIKSLVISDNGKNLYIANSSMERVEVYYNIHLDASDRVTPDAYYSINTSPELSNNIINQIKVVSNASIIDSTSSVIYVATDYGMTQINTDESSPGASESGGISFIYGIEGSGSNFEIVGGNVNRVISVDVNRNNRQIFIATDDDSHDGGLTIINIPSNTRFAFKSQNQGTLISNEIRDITFKNL